MMLCSRVVRTVSGPLTAGAASEVSTLGGIVLGYRLMVSGAMGQRKTRRLAMNSAQAEPSGKCNLLEVGGAIYAVSRGCWLQIAEVADAAARSVEVVLAGELVPELWCWKKRRERRFKSPAGKVG